MIYNRIMLLVRKKITLSELKTMSAKMFDTLVKAVVDVKKEIMVVDAPMHSDEEAELIKNGSKQEDLWGINFYPEEKKDFVEFDSMINLKPNQNNRSRGVEDKITRKKIIEIVNKLVQKWK